MTDGRIGRRGLLGGALALGGLMAAPAWATAGVTERRLVLRNVHNGEMIDARWLGAGGPDADGLAAIDRGMRDWRTGEVARIDRRLILLLTNLRDRLDLDPRTPFELISGYRSPVTNARLRGRHGGVAKHSQHMLGKASDIAVRGVPVDRLRAAALSLRAGGVGYYPDDGFVHVDTGRVRSW